MAVERPAGYDPAPSDPMSDASNEIEIQEEVGEGIIENEDGSVTIGGEESIQEDIPFGANLAEILEDDVLESISSELREQFEDDKSSRDEWYFSYTKV